MNNVETVKISVILTNLNLKRVQTTHQSGNIWGWELKVDHSFGRFMQNAKSLPNCKNYLHKLQKNFIQFQKIKQIYQSLAD